MIPSFIRNLFILNYEYENVIEHQRARRLLQISSIVLLASSVWFVFLGLPAFLNGTGFWGDWAIPLAGIGVSATLHNLIQRGQALWSSRLFVLFIFVASVPINNEFVNTPLLANALLPIVLAGILLDRRSLSIVTSLVLVVVIQGLYFGNISTDLNFVQVLSLVVAIGFSGLFLGLFNKNLEQITQSAADLIVKTRQLNNYKQDNETDTNQQVIISNVITLLRSLGYNYVRVIVLNEDYQPLHTYYSSLGVEQVAETTTFSFTSNSAFQQAIETASATIITQQDAGNLSAHLLPSSNMGVIIPAQGFNQIIALFDIQAETTESIAEEAVAILELFIKQFARNMIYHQTVNSLRDDIHEQQTIIEQQRTQLQNIQHLQTEGIVTDWQNYLQQRGLNAIGYDIDNRRQISDLDRGGIPEDLRPAFEQGETIIQHQGQDQLVTIPIRFRDTILGAISFTIPKEIPMTERKLDFIRSVTDRLALALDNKRLLEQTQTQAKREGIANEIGSELLTSTDVQTVLQTAVNQFNEALGAVSTQIYLQPTGLQSTNNQQQGDPV
jgi:hypothetical protein